MNQISLQEAVSLAATSGPFYSRYFFPKTVRQHTPQFHEDMWSRLDDPLTRYVSFDVFRDGAKTTLLRLFASKRIAYGVSHNILYTSNSERHACRSIAWIKRQVEFNLFWAQTFGLRKGSKWSENEMEIIHGVDEYPIYVLAVGITGQIRGINFDDYRPDLIVCDDVDNEETTGTEDQRTKTNALFFGALAQGLASPVDSPLAKLALAATPLADGDCISTCAKDPTFSHAHYGCFDDNGQSRWEDKFPTEFLLKEKAAYVARGQLNLWMREKECRILSSEMASFKVEWLKTWDVLPEGMWYVIAIDPATSDPKRNNTGKLDDFAMVVLGFLGRKVYLCDVFAKKNVDPDQAIVQLFHWIDTWQPRKLVCETVAFQKILKWYIEKEMLRQRKWRPITSFDDKRAKGDRILQAFVQIAPYGDFYYHKSQLGFVTQFSVWFPGAKMHEDILDAIAIGLSERVQGDDIEGDFERIEGEEKMYRSLEFRSCP
jgi:hypothetical protein